MRLSDTYGLHRQPVGEVASEKRTGIDLSQMAHVLKAVPEILGCLDWIELGQPFTVLIDYAHTADGLLNVLTAIRAWANVLVITLAGSGGDRDRGKRPKMAQVVVDGSDAIIFTSDNPCTFLGMMDVNDSFSLILVISAILNEPVQKGVR